MYSMNTYRISFEEHNQDAWDFLRDLRADRVVNTEQDGSVVTMVIELTIRPESFGKIADALNISLY